MRPLFALLAAGSSQRMGRPKQLLPLGDGCLLEHCLHNLTQAAQGAPVLLILGANYQEIVDAIDPGSAVVLRNTQWRQGLSASLRLAVDVAEQMPGAPDALVVALADQPAVKPAHYARLWQELDPPLTRLVASRYRGRPGVPAAFHASLFPELRQLTGDRGAKALFQKYAAETLLLDCPAAALDLDTPQDWQQYLRHIDP